MKCRIAFILAAAVIAVFWQAGYSGSAPTLTAAMTNYDCGDVNRDGGREGRLRFTRIWLMSTIRAKSIFLT
jgi:hypothetical protein